MPAAADGHAMSRLAFARSALAATLIAAAAAAHAGLTPMDEAELAAVNGRAAPPTAAPLPPGAAGLGLAGLIPADHLHTTLLDRAAFDAALLAAGITPFGRGVYDGRPVAQVTIDGAPFSVSMELSALLLAGTHLSLDGPSMGTVSFNNVDARGTTLWIWGH
jgi:hypothetical protein